MISVNKRMNERIKDFGEYSKENPKNVQILRDILQKEKKKRGTYKFNSFTGFPLKHI